jgi:DNA-binding response OmpR family regulator
MGGMRVLVIDDDQGIRSLLHRAFEESGIDASSSATGIEGLRRALTGDFGLVVLDLGLPDLAGTAVLGALVEQRPEQKVLVLSAANSVDDRVVCFERGAVDFVPKPFALRELVARVRSRLHDGSHGPTVEADTLAVGGLELDLRRRRVTRAGQTVDLSPREFHLLEHMMRRGGRVCTREELLAEVWGFAAGGTSNVVDVTMRRLRHKLGNPDSLETVRNVGYAIV